MYIKQTRREFLQQAGLFAAASVPFPEEQQVRVADENSRQRYSAVNAFRVYFSEQLDRDRKEKPIEEVLSNCLQLDSGYYLKLAHGKKMSYPERLKSFPYHYYYNVLLFAVDRKLFDRLFKETTAGTFCIARAERYQNKRQPVFYFDLVNKTVYFNEPYPMQKDIDADVPKFAQFFFRPTGELLQPIGVEYWLTYCLQ
jgi:hypothetical protein